MGQPDQRRLIRSQLRIDREIATPRILQMLWRRRPRPDPVDGSCGSLVRSRDCAAGTPTRALMALAHAGTHMWRKSASWIPATSLAPQCMYTDKMFSNPIKRVVCKCGRMRLEGGAPAASHDAESCSHRCDQICVSADSIQGADPGFWISGKPEKRFSADQEC
jgi:hypothetical protein